jgi:predicted nuclease with TOPRIM domain
MWITSQPSFRLFALFFLWAWLLVPISSDEAPVQQPSSQTLIEKSIALTQVLQANNEKLKTRLTELQSSLNQSLGLSYSLEQDKLQLTKDLDAWQSDFQALTQTYAALSTNWQTLTESWDQMTTLYESYLETFNDYKLLSDQRIRDLQNEQIVIGITAGAVGIGVGLLLGYVLFHK